MAKFGKEFKRPALDQFKLRGLIAATFTPFKADGAVDLARIKPVIDKVIAQGATGLYVCGSTGEGPLLSTRERLAVAEATVKAAAGRVPVIIQVGHNSIEEARGFAAHAQEIGADAISATPPGYFKPQSLETFVECIAHVANGAPKLPFYYYHIPVLSGVRFDMVDFLDLGRRRIASLRGIKFSDQALYEMQACIAFDAGRFDILFGVDEMLLGGLVFGAQGAVGSTFNFAAPLYNAVIREFQAGNLPEASRLQAVASQMIRTIISHGGRDGLKATMALIDADCGVSRLPTAAATVKQRAAIKTDLKRQGLFTGGKVFASRPKAA